MSDTRLVDCAEQRKRFDELLACEGDTRILTVFAPSGWGKTKLLKELQEHAIRNGAMAVRLPLQDERYARPFDLVDALANDLRYQHPIRRFDEKRKALWTEVPSTDVHVQNNNFSAAKGVTIGRNVNQITLPELPADTLQLMQALQGPPPSTEEECIDAFFADVRDICQEHSVVLLLDTLNRCPEALRAWLDLYLLKRHFFDRDGRPERLFLVLSDVAKPSFRLWPEETVQSVVCFEELSPWSLGDIADAYQARGLDPDPEHVERIYLVTEGLPPGEVLNVIHITEKALRR